MNSLGSATNLSGSTSGAGSGSNPGSGQNPGTVSTPNAATTTPTPAPTPPSFAAKNTWSQLATAPIEARSSAAAVWTGKEMIVWGGVSPSYAYLNTGGRYNPKTKTWLSMNTDGAPSGRYNHTMFWSGSKVVVFDGMQHDANGQSYPTDGAIYDPATDSWSPMAPPPFGARTNLLTWSLNGKMVVLAGQYLDQMYDGGVYDAATNSWEYIPAGSQSGKCRGNVLLGSKLYQFCYLGSGVYDLNSKTWSSIVNLPALGLMSSVAALDGKLVVQDKVYDPSTNTFAPLNLSPIAPVPLPLSIGQTYFDISVNKKLVFTTDFIGTPTGAGVYDGATNSLISLGPMTNVPPMQGAFVQVWTGSSVLRFGGVLNQSATDQLWIYQ